MSASFVIALLFSFAFLASTPTAFPVFSQNGTVAGRVKIGRVLPEDGAFDTEHGTRNPFSSQLKDLLKVTTDIPNVTEHMGTVLSDGVNTTELNIRIDSSLKILRELKELVLELQDDMDRELERKINENARQIDFVSGMTRTEFLEFTNKDFHLTSSPQSDDFSFKETNTHSNLNSPANLDYTEENENEQHNSPSLNNLSKTTSMADSIENSVSLDYAKENIENSYPLSNKFSEKETNAHLIPDTSLTLDYSAENIENNLKNQEISIVEFNKTTITSGTGEENITFISSHSDSEETSLKSIYASETQLDSEENSFRLLNILSTAVLNKTQSSPTTETNELPSDLEEKIHDADITHSSMKTSQQTQTVYNHTLRNFTTDINVDIDQTTDSEITRHPLNIVEEESSLESATKIGTNEKNNSINMKSNQNESFGENITSANASNLYESNKSTNNSSVTRLSESPNTLKFYFGLHRSNLGPHLKKPIEVFLSKSELNTTLHFNDTKSLDQQTSLKESTKELINSEPREHIGILKPAVQVISNFLGNKSLGYLKSGFNYTTPLSKPLHNPEVDSNIRNVLDYKEYDLSGGNSDMSLEGAKDHSLSVPGKVQNDEQLDHDLEAYKQSKNSIHEAYTTSLSKPLHNPEVDSNIHKSDHSDISNENSGKVTTISITKETELVPDTSMAYETVESDNVPEKIDASPNENIKLIFSGKLPTKEKFLDMEKNLNETVNFFSTIKYILRYLRLNV